MDHKVLFVDDEENILKALRRLLRRTGYELYFADSGKAALEIVRSEQMSVIVSDMRMPEMNGVELVRQANEIDPLSVKIILSGYADIGDIMSAVNGGHVHSYITKPWEEADLVITLMNACELFERRMNEKHLLNELRDKNDELRALNENLEKIVQARTWQINESHALLNDIVRGEDERTVLSRAARVLSKLAGDRRVALRSEVSGNVFEFPEGGQTQIPEPVMTQIREKRSMLLASGAIYYPFVNHGSVLGTLVISPATKEDAKLIGRMGPFLSEILIFVSQQHALEASPDVIGSIDALLGEIEGA